LLRFGLDVADHILGRMVNVAVAATGTFAWGLEVERNAVLDLLGHHDVARAQ
jgi:hypothetical protein